MIAFGSFRVLKGRGRLGRVFVLFVHAYTRKRGTEFLSVVAVGACWVLVNLTVVVWWGERGGRCCVLASIPLDGLTFCGVADLGFSFHPDTLFVDAGKMGSSCRFHTPMPYPVHWRVLVFLGWILLGRGDVIVYVHAVDGLPCRPLATVGAALVAAEGGVLRLVDEPYRNERL